MCSHTRATNKVKIEMEKTKMDKKKEEHRIAKTKQTWTNQ